MSDTYLLDAGWFFFAAWGVVVLCVSWAAFGRDLFPVKAREASRRPGTQGSQAKPSTAR